MKKIIAAAVASAFIAPAFAANENFTLSGDFEYRYKSGDHITSAADAQVTETTETNSFGSGDQTIYVEGSTETESGLSLSAYSAINNDSDGISSDADTHIKIAGGFGSLSLGDVASALDNVGDYSDVAPATGGFAADGGNTNILFVAPTMVEGLKVSISHGPDADNGTADVDNYAGRSKQNSYSVAYGFSGGEVYYGVVDKAAGTEDITAYGVKASFGGLMIAAETGTFDDGTTERDTTGLAATYSVGDTTFMVESQEEETGTSGANNGDVDTTVIAVKQSIGGGLSVYLEAASIERSRTNSVDSDFTTLGVDYHF